MASMLASLRMLRVETILTAMVISMPIMNPFFASIGMDQGQIGLSQAIFTAAAFVPNIVFGRMADRFGRKWFNAGGDFLVASGFVLYAFIDSFSGVVFAEVLIGIGIASTNGVDGPLRQIYCAYLNRKLEHEKALVEIWRPLAEAAGVIFGGSVGAFAPRFVLGLTALPFVIGGVLSLFLQEAKIDRIKTNDRRTLKAIQATRNLGRIFRYTLHDNHQLKWLTCAYAVGREITHSIVWVLVPLMLLAGVPLTIVGIGWALNLAAASLGSWIAKHYSLKMGEPWRFIVPMIAVLIAMLVLSFAVTLWSIGLYAVFGLARGWGAAVYEPMIQRHAPLEDQTTILSVASSLSQLLYIPLVWGVNSLGNSDIRYVVLGNMLIFLPLVCLVGYKLLHFERKV